ELKEAFEPDYTEPSCDVCEVTPSFLLLKLTTVMNQVLKKSMQMNHALKKSVQMNQTLKSLQNRRAHKP
ncbi:hypothetical protein M9458_028123, partial [Cirrhinus mrigala]